MRSALAAAAAEDDSARTVQTTDAEGRERLELRAKTGLADFLKAAAGGAAVTGAAAEYAASLRRPGDRPPADGAFCAHSAHSRDAGRHAWSGREGNASADRPVRVRAKSAAASLGIMMPTVPSGQVQIPKITTAPPADTLAKDGAAPAAAAAVTLVNQAPVRIAGSFEVRVEDLAVMPTLESALSESMQGSMSNELDESTFNGAAGELNGLFVASDERQCRRGPSRPIRRASVASRRWWTGDTPIPSLMCGPSSAPIRSRSTRACSPTPTRAT